MVSQNIEYLREHGPAPAEALPNASLSTNDRMNGVWRVNPSTRGGRYNTWSVPLTSTRNLVAVYYLKDEHSAEQVAEAWVDANSDVLARLSRGRVRRVVANLPDDIETCARAVLGIPPK